jgi:AAA ATPase-like protein
MKLKKLVLKGFRSVKSEEELLIDDRITILIGANDHGKTNLLWAIKSLNDDTPIGADDRHWDLAPSATVEIKWHFVASEADLKKLQSYVTKAKPAPVSAAAPQDPAPQDPAPQNPAPQSAPRPPPEFFPLNENKDLIFARDSLTNKIRVVATPVLVSTSMEANVLSLRPGVELFASPSTNVTDQVNLQQLDNDPQFEFIKECFGSQDFGNTEKIFSFKIRLLPNYLIARLIS